MLEKVWAAVVAQLSLAHSLHDLEFTGLNSHRHVFFFFPNLYQQSVLHQVPQRGSFQLVTLIKALKGALSVGGWGSIMAQ